MKIVQIILCLAYANISNRNMLLSSPQSLDNRAIRVRKCKFVGFTDICVQTFILVVT